ncbi:MAG: c-type cytochrome, partial [Verrucomicrobiales bacterium]|nr:c-type cytochrome [Verrucomicrobiales bacterium]
QATPVFHEAQRRLADTTIAAPERLVAAELLLRHPDLKGEAIPFLAAGIAPQSALTFQQDCLRALQGSEDPRAGAALLERWSMAGASLRPALLDAMLSRADWTRPLAQALDAGGIAPTAFDAARRGRLLRHADPAVRAVAEKAFGAGLRSPRADVVTKYRDALQKTGEAGHGAAHYTRLCATCHRRGDEGRDIGPDLKSVIQHPPEKLLVNILDPNADVQPGFHAFQATLTGGEELYGIIAAETGNSVLLKLADGSVRTLLRSQIESLRGSDLSLMPEGLEAGLTSQDLADLIAFLKTP